MQSRHSEFLGLIDRAAALVGGPGATISPEHDQRLQSVLQSLRQRLEAGQLEPSAGVLTLGLARQVADTAPSLASPLLEAVAELERYYQEHYRQ